MPRSPPVLSSTWASRLARTGLHSSPRRARNVAVERPHPAKDFTGTRIVTRGTWHGRRVDIGRQADAWEQGL
jgi:hypothetical protein